MPTVPLARVRCLTLAACVLLARAQAPDTRAVTLNVTALDAKGHPVTDLTSADFQIFDQGKLQHIASFQASAAEAREKPSTTLIFFDLLNAIPGQREYESSIIIHALEPLERGDSVYLYLLTNHGDLYPIHALPTAEGTAPVPGAATPWTGQIHPLLDRAIRDVYGLRPMTDKDQGIRTATTFQTLGELVEQLTGMPGPKTIVWITRGVPNWLHYPYGCKDVTFPEGSGSYLAGKCTSDCAKWRGEGKCIDYTPFLRHFSAELERTGTIIYSVEETAEGSLPPADRGSAKDTLQQLANLTGGRTYSNGETEKAIAQSLEDARGRYRLAYDAPPTDGKYHKLRMACTRKDVRLEAQRGYFADQP